MTDTDRQADQGWWTLGVHIQADDSLADVRERILANLRFMVESHAPPPIPRSVAQRLLAEVDGGVMAPTGHTMHPNPSVDAQGREVPLPPSSIMVAESGPEREGGAAAAEPRERGYSVQVTTHRFPRFIRCSVCERQILSGARYKRVEIGCQTFRVHDGCLARVQREIAASLHQSDPATDDEPEEDTRGND